MKLEQILDLANFIAALVSAGVVTWAQIKAALAVSHPNMTDDELNTLEQWVIDDAQRREAQRLIDASS